MTLSNNLGVPGGRDPRVTSFLAHLATDKGASVYTQRNYRQALFEFCNWLQQERLGPPDWARLGRDDFRAYLRNLGRHNRSRAAIQLRFSALRSFYRFLVRGGVLAASPIRNLALPRLPKRLPQFLTVEQMKHLLDAPEKLPHGGETEAQRREASIT